MKNGLLIVAHAPLASALRQCVGHVFPDQMDAVQAFDVPASASIEQSLAAVRQLSARLGDAPLLIMTDVLGATPCNVARRLLDQARTRVVAGVNLPMLLRAVTYRHEPLDELVARALLGGAQGVVQVTPN